MGFGITIRVRGDYALFTRPEMKVERVSYDVITPSAARGIIEAIYWKPAIRWVIDRICVSERNPVHQHPAQRGQRQDFRHASQRRMNGANEPFFMDVTDKRQQRAAMVLRDVDYVIEAHFELTDRAGPEDTVEKHYNIVLRRLRRGQHYHAPCLGAREFPAQVEFVENGDVPASRLIGTRDLGWMLYDLDFADPADIQPQFFKAELHGGVLDLRGVELKG